MNQHIARVLCVDDEPLNLSLLEAMLSPRGYEVVMAENGPEALEKIGAEQIDICLLDVMMPGMDGFEVCRRIKSDDPQRNIPVVMITSYADLKNRIRGIEAGAEDFISKPFDSSEVLARIKMLLHVKSLNEQLQNAHDKLEQTVGERTRELTSANMQLTQEIEVRKKAEESLRGTYAEIKALKDRLQAENIYLQQEVARQYNFGEIIGQSDVLSHVFLRVEQVAPMNATVLLLGETGTGKGVVARAIHSSSARKDRPLITVNCTTLPAALVESELFGRERGAFTGSDARQIGRFELADGGTIFLDEIGEMPMDLQSKLLRVIQDGEFERLGSPRTIKTDVRIIAATNRNLAEEDQERQVPGRPVLPAQCFPHHDAAASAAQGRHSAARQSFCRQIQQENRQEDRDRVKGHPERPAGIPLARQRAGAGKCHRAGGHHQPGERRCRSWTGSNRSARRRNRTGRRSRPSSSWNTTTSSRCSRRPAGASRGKTAPRCSLGSTPALFAPGCGNTASRGSNSWGGRCCAIPTGRSMPPRRCTLMQPWPNQYLRAK